MKPEVYIEGKLVSEMVDCKDIPKTLAPPWECGADGMCKSRNQLVILYPNDDTDDGYVVCKTQLTHGYCPDNCVAHHKWGDLKCTRCGCKRYWVSCDGGHHRTLAAAKKSGWKRFEVDLAGGKYGN